MKIKPSVLLAILAAAILISLMSKCSSSSSFSLNLFKHNVTTSVTTIWDKTTTDVATGEVVDSLAEMDIPVVVVYKDVKVGDTDRGDALTINVSNQPMGSFSTPLIKRASFHYTVNSQNRRLVNTDSTHLQTIVNGTVTVSGRYTIFGFISKGDARRLIASAVLKVIYKDAKKQLNSSFDQQLEPDVAQSMDSIATVVL
jgi:hypothetical protein